MATDKHFESGMGASQGQGAAGNEYGVGTHDKDAMSSSNEEGMGAGQVRNQAATSNRENEFGMGNQAVDVGSSRDEEGMGAGTQPQTRDDGENEYGMGSGRPEGESGGKGGGLLKKVENVFKKH